MASVAEALETIIYEVASCYDRKQGDGAAEYFTHDAEIWDSTGRIAAGPEAMHRLQTRCADHGLVTRHVHNNVRLLDGDERHARAHSVLTLYMGPGSCSAKPCLIADDTYDFVLGSDGQWRIRRRTVSSVFGDAPTV